MHGPVPYTDRECSNLEFRGPDAVKPNPRWSAVAALPLAYQSGAWGDVLVGRP